MSILEGISLKTSFIPDDASLDDVALILAESDTGVVGITSDGLAAGTLTAHDLVIRAVALGRDLSKVRARDLLDRPPVTVEWPSNDSDLLDAAILMSRTKAKHAIVTHSGVPIGVESFNALTRYTLDD